MKRQASNMSTEGAPSSAGVHSSGTGRSKKREKRKKFRREPRPNQPRSSYIETSDRRNAALEEYYREQRIVSDEEFEPLLVALATPLPTAFRVAADSRFCDDIIKQLDTRYQDLFKAAADSSAGVDASDANGAANGPDSEPLRPPTRMPWYPNGLGWSVCAPRAMVRRDNSLAPFHKFIVRLNELGAINRQEAVSMVPPLLLDVERGQSVIDLCAAPGSKTAQLLEALAVAPIDESTNDATVAGVRKDSLSPRVPLCPPGLVIANDSDIKRCWLLAHQLRRFGAPNFVVTHHDASAFPGVTSFDRVLCDVPCTGDGTLRKAPDMWRKWTPALANGIHRLQKNILRRGVELLRPGGRLVYSTCSMNPVENEAVIADALRHFGPGCIRLVDVSSRLPLLKRRVGLKTWKVKDMTPNLAGKPPGARYSTAPKINGSTEADVEIESEKDLAKGDGWFTTFDSVPERKRNSGRVVSSLFPPSAEELESGEFPLDRCVRLVPIDQDTGAFFVAVLEKLEVPSSVKERGAAANLKKKEEQAASGNGIASTDPARPTAAAENETGTVQDQACNVAGEGAGCDTRDAPAGKQKNKKGGGGGGGGAGHTRLVTDDPLVGIENVCAADVTKLASFFGLSEEECRASLMTRGSEAGTYKKVLAVSPAVRELLTKSFGSVEGKAAGVRGRLRVVNAGVRVFERTGRRDAEIPFRILSDGMQLLGQSMRKRIVQICAADLKRVMEQDPTAVSSLTAGPSRTKLADMAVGSALLVHGGGKNAEVVLVWKGAHMISKSMPEDELAAIRSRHGFAGGKSAGRADQSVELSVALGKQPMVCAEGPSTTALQSGTEQEVGIVKTAATGVTEAGAPTAIEAGRVTGGKVLAPSEVVDLCDEDDE